VAPVARASEDTVFLTVYYRNANGTTLGSVDSNPLSFGSTVLPAPTDWPAPVTSSTISEEQVEELICRLDELDFETARALANIRHAVMTDERRGLLSKEISALIDGTLAGLSQVTSAEGQKLLWRLMTASAAKGTPL